MRQTLVSRLTWAEPHLQAYGAWEQAQALTALGDDAEIARQIPQAWLHDMAACGTPDQTAESLWRLSI
jgi:hypothetical protein